MQQQVEALVKDNTVLKRAVAIQHERQKAFEDANQQVELLKQLIPQYQEKLRTLEVSLKTIREVLSISCYCLECCGDGKADVVII